MLTQDLRIQPIALSLSSPCTTSMISSDDNPAPFALESPSARTRAGRILGIWVGCFVVLCCLPACRTYTDRTHRARALFESGQFERAAEAYADKDVTGSTFLSGAEGGLAALMAGDLDRAIELLGSAADYSEEVENQALLDPSAFTQSLTSWALSETTVDYKGEGYERVMVHACLGLAYLARGEIDDLLVEVRRANALLAAEEELYETEYEAGGFGHYLSALGYELRGQYDEAYIDYYAMYQKGLASALVEPALIRYAQRMHREDEIADLIAARGPVEPIPADAANVVLIAGVGYGPEKLETRLDVPTSNGVFSWAVPQFSLRRQNFHSIQLQTGELAAQAVILEDVGQVAKKNLSDRLAFLSVKSAVRGILKQKMAREIGKKHGEGAYALAQIFSIVTERADLRSWQTLPATWQAARTYPRPGLVDISITLDAGQTRYLGTYDMAPGETIFLLARTIGPRVYAQVIGGHRVDPDPASSAKPSETPTTTP